MIVFLDLDGVLVDFNKRACTLLGHCHPPKRWKWYDDFYDGFNKLDCVCNSDFWENLEWMPDGIEILNTIERYISDNIYILTTPMPNSGSASGKVRWIKKNMRQYSKSLIITTTPKEIFARTDTLLIDDCTENVDKFRQAGGQTILVPRSWNSLHLLADDSINVVKSQLENLI